MSRRKTILYERMVRANYIPVEVSTEPIVSPVDNEHLEADDAVLSSDDVSGEYENMDDMYKESNPG